ncbi:hypothetical protein Taro_042825 [Colocasia esculenta]|uniref:Uncharacterized protein n=1 Tax=Colocasia esculenta TaxID=4460 RepID=A0A843WJC7_COLES|nr:hypothetical protein [Colocasia esculenta]
MNLKIGVSRLSESRKVGYLLIEHKEFSSYLLCLPSFGRSGPARAVSISSTEASLFGTFNFISGILSLTRYCLAKLAFQPSNTLFSCGHPQFSRLLTLAHFSNLEIIGFSIALQSFKSLGPGRLNLTGVHPVPNIGDKIHPTLLLDSHAKGRSRMLLQRLSNNFNGRRVCGVCQCRYSANKEFPAAIISKMRGWLRPFRPSYTMLRGSTNLQERRALLVKVRHNVCPRREISNKKKAVSKTKLVGRLEVHRQDLTGEGLRLHLWYRPLERRIELGSPKTGSLKFPNSGWRSSPLRQNMNMSFPSQLITKFCPLLKANTAREEDSS